MFSFEPPPMPCHAPAKPAPDGTIVEPAMKMVESTDGEAVMVMGGMPTWFFIVAVVAILLVSFVLVERFGSRGEPREGFRIDLLARPWARRMVKSRWFQLVPQLAMVGAFFFLIWVGLTGSRIGNLTPVAVWTIWWAGLVFAVALAGPLFCFACPWDGIANIVSRLTFWKRTEPISLGLKVPRIFRNVWPATVLFVGLTWAELGLGITTDPRATATMGLGMAIAAVACVLVFRKKAFCNYLCPVGRISGIYANFAPVEIRARDRSVCSTCRTQECLTGNERGYPCPTGLSLRVLNTATKCTMCTECVRSCDQDNVAINLRPFGRDLLQKMRKRPDEAWLCIILLTLTLFHGMSMTTTWENFLPGEPSLMKWMSSTLGTGRVFNFTLGMLVIGSVPIALYELSCKAATTMTRGSGVNHREIFLAYAYSLLPVALFYHLAHNAMHILMEGGSIVPALSDPRGRGENWFGTADVQLGHLVAETTVWWIQIGLIIIGHIVGIAVAHRISRRLFEDPKMATRSLVPMLVVMVLISIAGLSLMVLDMNMRVGRM